MQYKDNFSSRNSNDILLFHQHQVPIFQNKVYLTEQQAAKAETGEVLLMQSALSGFIYNANFDSNKMVYDQNYQNEQANSQVFKNHLNDVLALLKGFGLENKKIVEIGCGKGVFFDMMLNSGLNCWGYDPTYEGVNERIIKDYFSAKYTDIKADVIILRHTMEHIENPFSFIHTIATANNYQGKVFIEVPTFNWIESKLGFWDIFYEHCNYFTEQSFAQMFNEAVTGTFFGGQYMYVWADLSSLKPEINPADAAKSVKKVNQLIFSDKIIFYKNLIANNGTFAIWGAGAKGSTFLNLLDANRQFVQYVIDINPAKQNRFIAVTGHPIYSPEVLETKPVDNILIMNENYIDEIKSIVKNKSINFFNL